MIRPLIPSGNDEMLARVLTSLHKSEVESLNSVIVGEHGISGHMKSFWASLGVTFVPVPEPFNFSQAINICARAAGKFDDLLILGDDTEMLTPYWQTMLQWALDETRALEAYGLLSLQVIGRVANAEQKLWTTNPLQLKEAEWTICFVAVLISYSTWLHIGPMDERYVGVCHDDDDYTVRCWHAGVGTAVTSGATVVHGRFPSSPFAKSLGQTWEEKYDLNSKIFQEKFGITIQGRKGLSRHADHRGCFCKK